jgi:cytochrome b involved in lipid metabolism
MFAGGSGIAPFRSFWQARIHAGCPGRNLLFLGVKDRSMLLYEHEIRDLVRQGKLEVHIAFSRDRRGLVYDRAARALCEKDMDPRYIDSAIQDCGDDISDIIASTEMGGLGGYIYVCGSCSFYETVSRALLNVSNHHTAEEHRGTLLEAAFAEGRVMLDVFTPPCPEPLLKTVIKRTTLARYTGHRAERTWIAVHGKVYDVTDFLPIHPGGSLIVTASAGLDVSTTFDRVGHTSNGEVMSLLSSYLIGSLDPLPKFTSPELINLFDMWHGYLDSCVESLTAVWLDITSMQDVKTWSADHRLDLCKVRKLYQFQSRFMEAIVEKLYGSRYFVH